MRWVLIYCFLGLLQLQGLAQNTLPPIGGWREHLPYRSVKDLAILENNTLIAATTYSLFTYQIDESYIERISKTSGLSGSGIQLMHATPGNKLIVVYNDNNIDVITSSAIRNIRDIVNSNQVPQSGIFALWSNENSAYLSTAIGIIVLNLNRFEVTETWRIGHNGQSVKTNDFTQIGGRYYAATDEGLKSIPVNGANPADYNNWELLSGNTGLPAGKCDQVFLIQNQLIALADNRFYILRNNHWDLFYETDYSHIRHAVNGNRLTLCQQLNGHFRIQVLDENAAVTLTLNQGQQLQHPQKAIWFNDECWIADSISGLLRYSNGQYTAIVPESPASIAEGNIFATASGIVAARGAVNNNTGSGFEGSWFLYKENTWQNFERIQFPALDSFPDLHHVVLNNITQEVWAASWSGGLQLWKEGSFIKTYKQGFLGADVLNPQRYKTGGLALDVQSNLWISNPGSSNPLVLRTPDDTWVQFAVPFSGAGSTLKDIIVDDNGYKWISAAQNGLLVYSEGSELHSAADDKWFRYSFGAGQGNLPGTTVTAINKDRQGFIWAGTDNGIAVIECPDAVFTNHICEAIRPVIKTGSFAGYLFQNERVLCITTDAANRKWVGTEKGAWLVAANGDAIIEHWNTSNSPIPANRVHSIAIDPKTGEVFFATAAGIVSWRGTATAASEEKPQVQIFPNPVPPGYSGTIGIRGLKENSIVKITELNGRLVYQTRSLGGQAVWNGRDYRGRIISTGVYLVLVSDENNKEQTAGKIVFINK